MARDRRASRPGARTRSQSGPWHSLTWPARISETDAATVLDLSEFTHPGGGAAMRHYITSRLDVVAEAEPDAPREWCEEAWRSLREQVGDTITGGVQVSAAALQLGIAYAEHLEQAASTRRVNEAAFRSATLSITCLDPPIPLGWRIMVMLPPASPVEVARVRYIGEWPESRHADAVAFARGYAQALNELGHDCVYVGEEE